MICALTVRTLKPGSFERFRETFMAFENVEDVESIGADGLYEVIEDHALGEPVAGGQR